MAATPGDLWHVNLTKLTWIGWLLVLIATGIVFAVVLLVIDLISDITGVLKSNEISRIAAIAAILVSVGVFWLGKRFFEWAGFPIIRPDEP